MIEQYNAMCDKVLQSNDDSRKDAVMAYKTILDDLSILLKQNVYQRTDGVVTTN